MSEEGWAEQALVLQTTNSTGSFSSCIHNARRPSPLMMSSPYPPHKAQIPTPTTTLLQIEPIAHPLWQQEFDQSQPYSTVCFNPSIHPSLCKPFHRLTKKVILHQSTSSSYHTVLSSLPPPSHHHTTAF